MFRRIIASLALVGFVASQLAAVPHAHAGLTFAEQRDHDFHPHIHFGGGSHSHGHDHGPAHSHDGGHGRCPKSAPEDGSLTPPGHDADALYLHIGQDPILPKERAVAVGGLAALMSCPVRTVAGDLDANSGVFHPPDPPADGTKLFLKLRTLRI